MLSRCECKDGEFICQPTTCQDGLTPKGQLNKEVGLQIMKIPD